MREREQHLLGHVCRHHWSRQIMMKVDKFLELSASTVAFVSCIGRLTKVLAGASMREKESKSERG